MAATMRGDHHRPLRMGAPDVLLDRGEFGVVVLEAP